MSHFFWGNVGDNHKYHLVNWGMISQNKVWGGMGVPNLREFSMSFLAAWSKRFFIIEIVTGKNYLGLNIMWKNLTFSSPGLGWAPLFWKSITWAFSAANFFISGFLGMVGMCYFGMAHGLVIIHSKLGYGICILFVSNRMLLWPKFGMV